MAFSSDPKLPCQDGTRAFGVSRRGLPLLMFWSLSPVVTEYSPRDVHRGRRGCVSREELRGGCLARSIRACNGESLASMPANTLGTPMILTPDVEDQVRRTSTRVGRCTLVRGEHVFDTVRVPLPYEVGDKARDSSSGDELRSGIWQEPGGSQGCFPSVI